VELTRRSVVVTAYWWPCGCSWPGGRSRQHERFNSAAKNGSENRSKDIANTVSALIRGLRFRREGGVFFRTLEPVLNELVNGRTNELVKVSELLRLRCSMPPGSRLPGRGNFLT